MKENKLFFCIFILLMITVWGNNSFAEKLIWESGGGNPSGFIVYYGTDPQNLTDHADVGNSTQCSLDALPLQEKQTYYFAVKAYNNAGQSIFSEAISWKVDDKTPPLPPKGLKSE